MSEENVEVVRRWLEFWSTSPEQARSGVARFFEAHADYYPVPKFPEARPCHGQNEIAQFFGGFMGAWSRYEYSTRQLVEAGDDRVLVCGRVHAEGQGSGLILEGDLHYCMWLRHGRFFRLEDHLTMKGALHALGFEGETLEEAGLKGTGAADLPVSANLDLVRSIHAAWERGDFSSVEWADPEIDYEIVDGPTPGRWKGVSAMNAAWREFASAWKDFRVQSDDFRELDSGRVVCFAHFSALGKTSGLELGQVRTRGSSLFHVRGGKVTRLVIYWTADRAFADLDLKE